MVRAGCERVGGVLPLQPAAGGWWDELTTLRQRASWRVKAASAAVVWLVCAMGGRRPGSGGCRSGGGLAALRGGVAEARRQAQVWWFTPG